MARKKFDFKAFLISNGEKIALGVIAAIALFALATANWVPFNGNPADVATKIQNGTATFEGRTITPEDEKAWLIAAADRPASVIRQELLADVDPRTRQWAVKFAPSFRDISIPLREVQFSAPIELIATVGRRLFNEGQALSADTALADAGTATTTDPTKPTEDVKPSRPEGVGAIDENEFSRPAGGALGPDGMMLDSPTDILAAAPELQMMSTYGEDGLNEATLSLNGKGRYFISVRAAFMVKDNIEEIMKACNVEESRAAGLFYPIDFVLERQVRQPDGSWSTWAPVDRSVAEGILEQSDGFAEETLPPALLNPALAMPLPALIIGGYGKLGVHPLVENYRLSPDQVRIQTDLVFNAMKKQSTLPPTQPVGPQRKARGFSDYIFNTQEIMSGAMGAESQYTVNTNMEMGMMPSPNRPTRPGARAGAPLDGRQQLSEAAMALMADEINKERDPTKQKKLREDFEKLVAANVSAIGNVLLFRYLDFAVEPGKAYRYRARVVMANPNYGRRPSDAEDSSVVEGEERLTGWSNVSNAPEIERQTWYFVNQFDPRRERVLFNFVHYDLNYGTDVTNDYERKDKGKIERLAVAFGEPIGGDLTVPLLDPAKNKFDDTEYSFESGDLLVDGLEDITLDKNTHPDLKMVVGSAKSLQLTEPVLVVKTDGSLATVDTFSQKPYVDYFSDKLKKSYEPWEFLRQSSTVPGAGDGINDLFGSDTTMPVDTNLGMDESGMRSTQRRRNISRKEMPGSTAGERRRAAQALNGGGNGMTGDSPP
ncbi:MAG: hypothetical protein R3C01_00275 [Planctomycetaceae bacterium]